MSELLEAFHASLKADIPKEVTNTLGEFEKKTGDNLLLRTSELLTVHGARCDQRFNAIEGGLNELKTSQNGAEGS